MERKEEDRKKYSNNIKGIDHRKIVYIDESGIELRICKDKGWAIRGSPVIGERSGKYYKRINIIAGLVNKLCIAPMVFNGSCNTKIFNTWVEKVLLKELKPGQVVIMDNASFHKSQKSQELIESVGCKVIFLPPYSPDLNPIEKFWANLKRWIKNKIANFDQLYDALVQFFGAQTSA